MAERALISLLFKPKFRFGNSVNNDVFSVYKVIFEHNNIEYSKYCKCHQKNGTLLNNGEITVVFEDRLMDILQKNNCINKSVIQTDHNNS